MDLILRNARVPGQPDLRQDIGIAGGSIVAIAPQLQAQAPELDVAGRLVAPGFVETHVHLDKSRIVDRCTAGTGTLEEAISEAARAKRAFTTEDVYERAKRTLEQAISQGTTHMRTHLEVDPGIGLRGLEGVLPLVREYAWAIDLAICVFPQEGLINNPGTDPLLVEALRRGCRVLGAAPYTDSDPHAQIDRIFALAREFDVDVDMHLDFGLTRDGMDLDYVCEATARHRWGGRVAIGHVSKAANLTRAEFAAAGRRLADAGVALTVLPATDLYLMGRLPVDHHNPARGVTPAHLLLGHGVNCSLSTNNVLNPFTPYGDCSLIRMANLYANIAHIGSRDGLHECFRMITDRPADLCRITDHGVRVGAAADLVVLDCADPVAAVAELATPLYGFKRGRPTFTRAPVALHRPV